MTSLTTTLLPLVMFGVGSYDAFCANAYHIPRRQYLRFVVHSPYHCLEYTLILHRWREKRKFDCRFEYRVEWPLGCSTLLRGVMRSERRSLPFNIPQVRTVRRPEGSTSNAFYVDCSSPRAHPDSFHNLVYFWIFGTIIVLQQNGCLHHLPPAIH